MFSVVFRSLDLDAGMKTTGNLDESGRPALRKFHWGSIREVGKRGRRSTEVCARECWRSASAARLNCRRAPPPKKNKRGGVTHNNWFEFASQGLDLDETRSYRYQLAPRIVSASSNFAGGTNFRPTPWSARLTQSNLWATPSVESGAASSSFRGGLSGDAFLAPKSKPCEVEHGRRPGRPCSRRSPPTCPPKKRVGLRTCARAREVPKNPHSDLAIASMIAAVAVPFVSLGVMFVLKEKALRGGQLAPSALASDHF